MNEIKKKKYDLTSDREGKAQIKKVVGSYLDW